MNKYKLLKEYILSQGIGLLIYGWFGLLLPIVCFAGAVQYFPTNLENTNSFRLIADVIMKTATCLVLLVIGIALFRVFGMVWSDSIKIILGKYKIQKMVVTRKYDVHDFCTTYNNTKFKHRRFKISHYYIDTDIYHGVELNSEKHYNLCKEGYSVYIIELGKNWKIAMPKEVLE